MGLAGAFEVAKAWVTLGVNTKPLQDGLSSAKGQATKGIKDIQGSIKGILAAAGAGFGLAKAFSAVRESIALAEQEIQSQLRLAAVVKATGNAAGFSAEQIMAQASAFQDVTAFGNEEVQDLQSVLLTFKGISGPAFEATTEAALDMATVLGTDAKSAAIQLGKAMNDPILGATALSRAGVQFTGVQKEQIRAMQESGDLFGAQNIILKELQSQFSGAARAMTEGPIGALKQMKNATGDLWEDIGLNLVPIVLEFSKIMHEVVTVIKAATNALTGVTGKFGGLTDPMRKAIVGIGAFIAGYVGFVVIVPKVVRAALAIKNAILGLQSATFVGIATAVAGLAAGAALAAASSAAMADDIKAADAAAASVLLAQGDRDKILSQRTGGGTGGAVAKDKGAKKESVSLGFTGIADMGRKIQESLLNQKEEGRQERQLQISEENITIQQKILESTNAVRRNTEGGGGLTNSRGTI